MANRRPQTGNNRRSDFGRNDRGSNFGRNTVSPWQGGGPGTSLPSLLPLAAGSTEATLALASNIINLLQPRQNTVPSLLDMPIRRDFGPDLNRYNRGFGSNKMGNQGNFRRTGTYPRSGDRIGNRRPNRPSDGPRQQYKSSPKKDYDSKAKPVKESSEDTKDAEGKDKTEKVETSDDKKNQNRFSDIDPKLLICHICNKSMWDGRSFENHLNGRAHAIMMQKTAESYALTADTMRQEFKIREMKRTRKIGKQTPRDFYCAMCDLYAADGPDHRTTVGHRKLKKYLHPPCISCHKEMPTRIELDEHRLTPEHMRKIQGNPMQMQPEMMQIYTLSMEKSFVRENRDHNRRFNDRRGGKKDSDNQESETKADEEQGEKEETAENGGEEKTEGKDEETTEEVEEKIDSENTVIDFKEGDDLSNLTSEMLPKYSPKRGVGKSFLSEFRCIQCKLCNKLLDSDETAEVHLKTWRHHRLFTRALSKHIEPTEDKEDKEKEPQSNKRPLPTDESGNWKRRKVTTSENEEDQNGHEDEDMKDETLAEEDEEGGDEEMPSADDTAADDTAADESKKEEQAEKQDEEVKIKQEKDDEVPKTAVTEKVEEVEVKQEAKDTPAKGKPAPRGRGRGRRTRN